MLFTLGNVIQKDIPEVNSWHLLFFRAVLQIVVMSGDLCVRRIPLMGEAKDRLRVFLQGFMGGLLLLCIFAAIKTVPLVIKGAFG